MSRSSVSGARTYRLIRAPEHRSFLIFGPPVPLGRSVSAERQKHWPAKTQQGQGITVGLSGDGTPMKAVKGHAVSGLVGEDADVGTSVHERAGCQTLINRLVRRADPIGMLNGDNSSACDDSREGHDALSRAEHMLAHDGQQVDAAMTWRPLVLGLVEGAKNYGPR